MTLNEAQSCYLSLRARHLSPHTLRKYRIHLDQLGAWLDTEKLDFQTLRLLDLERFLTEQPICQNTASKEAQFYKGFFRFCRKRGLLETSPAEDLEIPRFQPPDNKPYTQQEIARILFACERVGQGAYERQRARAAILLLRHHGLRISDVLSLRRDAVRQENGYWILSLQTHKNHRRIQHSLPHEVEQALELLSVPIGAPVESEYFFWNGVGRFQNVMDNMQAILRQVYRLSGVPDAHNHRFRHTRASEILAVGGTMQDAADFLGITAQIAEKHYAKMMPERQARLDRLVEALAVREQTVKEFAFPV